jgi:hypothetical protein
MCSESWAWLEVLCPGLTEASYNDRTGDGADHS